MTSQIDMGTLTRVLEISQTFPGLPIPCVERPTLLVALNDLMSRPYDAILLEGDEDTGKTTALAQFVVQHERRAACLFLRPVTEFTYDPTRIRTDLCCQIHWQLTGKPLVLEESPGDADLRRLYHRLEKRCETDGIQFYFVIDGLADIPREAEGIRAAILNMLPLGVRAFRFLISGSEKATGVANLRKVNTRTQLITNFSPEEAQELFSGLASREQVIDIHGMFAGRPGPMASLRRIFSQGSSVEDALRVLETTEPKVFDLEWQRVASSNENTKSILEIVAHAPDIATTRDLSQLLSISEVEVVDLVGAVTFLKMDHSNQRVLFVSESFARYAQQRLDGVRRTVLTRAVKHLRDASTGEVAFRALPEYLEKMGQISALLEYMNTATITAALQESRSVSLVAERLKRTRKLAKASGNDKVALTYLLQRAALLGSLERGLSQVHVEAVLENRGLTSALSMANEVVAEEARLALLAMIGRKQRTTGAQVDPQLLREICRLANSIDWTQLRDRAFQIATELLPVAPDIGLSLLEKSVDRPEDSNSVDVAVVAAFIGATTRSDAEVYRRDMFESLFERSRSDDGRRLLASFSGLMPTATSKQLFSDLEHISNTSEKVYLLKWWLSGNVGSEQSGEVAIRLIDVLMNDSTYSPKVSDFVAVARVIATLPLMAGAERLLSVIEVQRPVLKKRGPIIDYVRLLCELTVARAKLASDDPLLPIVEELQEIQDLKDFSVKATCYSWVLSMCERLRSISRLNDDEWGVMAMATSELNRSLEQILRCTAEQREALRSLIDPLAVVRLEVLEAAISQVNVQNRRDSLSADAARHLLDGLPDHEDPKRGLRDVIRLLEAVKSRKIRDPLARRIVARASEFVKKGLDWKCLEMIEEVADSLRDADARGVAYARLLGGLPRDQASSEFAVRLKERIGATWQLIENHGEGIDCAFRISVAVQAHDPALAAEYCRLGEARRIGEIGLGTAAKSTLIPMLMIFARAISAAERAGSAVDADWNRLWAYSDSLPDKGDRARVAAYAALLVGRTKKEKALAIVESQVKPHLRSQLLEFDKTPTLVSSAIVMCAPALWMHHAATVSEFVTLLDQEDRDSCYYSIVEYLLYSRSPQEPLDRSNRMANRLSFEVASDVVRALSEVRDDSIFCDCLDGLLEGIGRSTAEARISRLQKAELLRQLNGLVCTKLPEVKSGIKHDGYKILCLAKIASIEQSWDATRWRKAYDDATAIPNAADASFVLSALVDMIPTKFSPVRQECFDRAAEIVPELLLIEDRMDRAMFLADKAKGHFPGQCKKVLSAVFSQSIETGRPSVERRRKSLLDLIYRIDPEAAGSLVSISNDDPAAKRAKWTCEEHLEGLKVSNKLRMAEDSEVGEISSSNYADACWMELGYLNATRATGRSHVQNVEMVEHCEDADLNESYAIISFAIEATAARYERTGQGGEFLRPFLHAAGEACDIAFLSSRLSGQGLRVGQNVQASSVLSASHVNSGSIDKVEELLGVWLQSSTSQYVKICDPYFRPEDLRLLRIVGAALPRLEVQILTSAKAQRGVSASDARAEFVREFLAIPEPYRPTFCQVVICGIKSSGLFSIHNRWLLADDLGIDLGTSVGSLGGERSYVLTRLDPATKSSCEVDVDEYLGMKARYWKEERINYDVFSLT